ncbi:MAG: Rpn family recombination-promoting nuclease/putative transposase, partial [Planctomycetaceae bacterium]|nr:Rpn family recombination-promoting nuclease/putative transposase [Planctomycetaceae bacterium]
MTRKSKKIVRKISAKFSNKQGGDIDAKELDIDITSLLCECDWKLVKRVFDLLFRSVMRHVDVAANFFESHIDPVYSSQIDFSKMKFWSPSHIDQNLKERIGDLLFIAPCRQTPDNPEQQQMNVSFICEHQSTVEHFMCIRAVEMAARDLTQFLDDLRIMIRREVEAKYVGEEVEIQFEILWQNVKVPYPMAVIVTNSKQHWKYKKMREVIAIPHKFDKNILNLPTFFIDISGLSEEELNRGMPVVRALKWAFRYDLDGTLVENHWRIFSILSEAAGDHRVKTWFFQFGTFILSRYEKNKIGKEDKRKFFKNIEKYYGQVTKDPKEVKQMTTTLLREIAKH